MMAKSFEEVVERHYESLYKFAFSLTQGEADACDLTQQTFHIWATKGHQLRDPSKTKAWLFTTLHRAFLETRRKRARFRQYSLEALEQEEMPAISADGPNAADLSQVLSALEKVDAVYQGAVALFYLEGCSYQQIAEILAVPLGTVKSRLSRGIMQLRGILRCVESEPAPEPVKPQASQELSEWNCGSR